MIRSARVAALSVFLALAFPGAAGADFGFQTGSAGFEGVARAEGGAPATLAGSHPYKLSLRVGLREAHDSPGEPGIPHSDGDLRNLALTMPPGLLTNARVVGQCDLRQFDTPRSSPFELSAAGESCPDGSQVGTVDVHSSLGAGSVR